MKKPPARVTTLNRPLRAPIVPSNQVYGCTHCGHVWAPRRLVVTDCPACRRETAFYKVRAVEAASPAAA